MIVDYLYFVSIAARPAETYTPLIVNPDTMLASPVAGQFFESISWWNSQVSQLFGSIQQEQLTQGYTVNLNGQVNRPSAEKKLFCFFAAKALYHTAIITPADIIVKRY